MYYESIQYFLIDNFYQTIKSERVTTLLLIVIFRQIAEIKELFNFLISQDAETAAAAYNTLICGKAKYLQV